MAGNDPDHPSDHDMLVRIDEKVSALTQQVAENRSLLEGKLVEVDCRTKDLEGRTKKLELEEARREGSWKGITAMSAGISAVVTLIGSIVGWLTFLK